MTKGYSVKSEAFREWSEGTTTPARLADKLKISLRTARSYIQEFKTQGYIKPKKRGPKANQSKSPASSERRFGKLPMLHDIILIGR